MTTAAPTRRSWLPALAFATAVVTLIADVLLMFAYVFELSTDGPYYLTSAHRVLGAISHVLIAIVVVKLSQLTEPPGPSRPLVATTVVVSLLGAVFLALGISGLLGFSVSSLVAVGVLIVQALWMLRANTWLYHHGVFPPVLARSGQVIGAGLLIGIALVAVTVFLPRLTLPHLIVLVAGVFIGGGQWLAWPVWFVMLGWYLRRAPDAAGTARPDVTADAVPGTQPQTVPEDEAFRGLTAQPANAEKPEVVLPPLWRHRSGATSRPLGAAPTQTRGEMQAESHPEPEPEPQSDFDRIINPQRSTDAKAKPRAAPRPRSKAAVAPRPVGVEQPEPDPEDVVTSRPPRAVNPNPNGARQPEPPTAPPIAP